MSDAWVDPATLNHGRMLGLCEAALDKITRERDSLGAERDRLRADLARLREAGAALLRRLDLGHEEPCEPGHSEVERAALRAVLDEVKP